MKNEIIYLDSIERLKAACKLYIKMGFNKCGCYNNLPEVSLLVDYILNWVLFSKMYKNFFRAQLT